MSFTHRTPFGLAKRATRHFFDLFLLVLFLLPVFAQAQVSPPGPSVCLNGPLPPFQSGSTPSNPGRWSNPKRPGLSWDFTFNSDPNNPNNRTLTAFWYGFAPPTYTTVSPGEPIWYISNTVQYDANNGWQAPLYRAIQTAQSNSQVAETIGYMAVSFVPGQPEHMAVSWQLRTMTAPVVECIQRLGSDANPNRTLVEQVGPAYSGLWYAPLSSGWGFQALIDLRAGAGGAVEFRESNIVSVYDTNGQPVWFAADGLPNSAWSSTPPPLSVTELPLKYVRATYDVTALVVPCVSGCTVLVPATGAGVTKFWRGYSNPASGSVGVNVNAQFGSRAVNFVRPTSASAATLFASEKLTQASNIVASPTNCVPSEVNATTCPVAVSWAVLTTGFFGSASALPYMRDLESNAETALPANSSGAVVQQLALGGRYQFFLRTSSGQVIAQSSEVRTLSPRLDDPAYAGLLDYVPAVQDTYAGTGGGSGGTSGGQASYSIPIQMAPGRHGMQPSVSINYSSRAGNGVAGMGWSVSAASSLHRCPKTRDQDGVASVVSFGVEDKLCLDGQRLIEVSGAYGEANTEYRTEIDGQAKVQQLGGNLDQSSASTYFVVYRADGMRDFYGARASANGTSSADANAQQLLSGNAKPLAWMLRESLDRSNNTVLYSYSTAADSYGSGELLLKKINYTGTLVEVGNRTVEFSYTPRPDISSSGLGGFLSRQTQVLSKIETRTPQGADAVALVRRYNLQYGANPAVIGVSKATGRAQLTQITECAADKCFKPTLLSWLDTPTAAPNLVESAIVWPVGMPVPAHVPDAPDYDVVKPIGDVDGDGVVEVQRLMRSGLTTVSSYIVSFKADRNARGFTQGAVVNANDVNNDGRADLWDVVPGASSGDLKLSFWKPAAGCVGTACSDWMPANFVPATVSLCALALPSSPIGSERFRPRMLDLNGDGLLDLMTFNRGVCNQKTNAEGIYVHLNTTSVAASGLPNFAPTYSSAVFTPLIGLGAYRQTIDFVDLDGNGVLEIVEAKLGEVPSQNVSTVYRAQANGSFIASPMSAIDADPVYARQKYFMDVNGDGLDDLLSASAFDRLATTNATCDSVWNLQINLGGKFSAPVPLTGAVRAGLEVDLLDAGKCNSVARDWNVTQSSLISSEDIDSDGRAELLVPKAIATPVCTSAFVLNGKPEPVSACAPEPRLSNPVGLPQGIFTLADYEGNVFYSPSPDGAGIRDVITDIDKLDSAAYRMSQLRFRQNSDGSYTIIELDLPVGLTRQVGAGENVEFDLFGDGLGDKVSRSGCKITWLGQFAPACTGTANALQTVSYWFNNGAGLRPGRAPETPELLKSVSDAYGKSIEWTYDALSSSANRTSGLPLYRLPARDGVGTDAPYIDAKHFYFASSMQVVSEMFTRNGIGSIANPGMNETRYGYEEAMYNQQGRGFQGFRKIISEDHTLDNSDNTPPLNGKFGLRNTTIFHQKFPLTGMVECEATTPLGMALDNCGQVDGSSSATLISASKTDYQCVVTGAATEASFSACATWANHANATYGFAFPKQTTGFQFDLNNQALMRTSSKTIGAIDPYGNVTAESLSNTSTFALGATERRDMSISRDYGSADTTNWWVNKLIKQTSTAAAVIATGTRVIDGTLNPARTSTMLYGYHANRQVNCEAMVPGATSASDCANAVMANSAVAQDGLVERRTTTPSFDDFGNVTNVSTQARGEALSRTLSSSYLSSAGYFPNSVTDALGAVTNSTFDNRFGKPNSITDPNQLASSTSFDGMGRELGMLFPSALVAGLTANAVPNQLAPPKRIAYETCTPLLCPTGAVLRVVSDQKGTPRQIAFMDALARTLRSAKAAFNQTDSSAAVLSWDTVDTQYSTRGLSYQTTEPRQILNNFLASTGLISGGISTTLKYDQLGRVLNKVSTRVARNDAGGSGRGYGTGLLYRTEYSHVGFKTAIRVCGLALNAFTCPASANTYGYVLDMAREFDESGAVINTTDAKNGVTSFFYDAVHSPVRLVDAENGITTANYNNVGHRTSVNDPNRGVWNYQYNGFGELKKQTDARDLALNQSFDALGRMTGRSWMQARYVYGTIFFNDTFAYNNDRASGQYGTLIYTERLGEGSVREEYLFDALNRPMQKNYVGNSVAGQSWNLTETTRYDPNFGRPVRKNFPAVAGVEPQKIYMGYTLGGDPMQTGFDNRYLSSDPRSSNPTRYLRRDEDTNARGQVLSARFGSGDASQAFQWLVSEYDASTGWLLSRCSGLTICSGVAQSGATNIDNAATMKLGYEYDYFGNVSKSVNVGRRPLDISNDVRQETFGYDQLHRMVDATRMGGGVSTAQVTYGYSPVGNLTHKSDFGSGYLYNDAVHKHAVKQVTLAGGAGTMVYDYDANGNVRARGKTALTETFGYDIDNRPQYTRTANAHIDFYLSATGAKALQVAASTRHRVVIYAGAYEAEYTNGVLSASRTYLAEGVLHNGAGLQQGLSFMYQDRLGSALVITDKDGLILGSDGAQDEFRTFDAFGKARDNQGLDSLDGRLFATNPNGRRNRKGFTGHEHLDEAGLIHMNGRAYDYNLGRFYGVDPVIQFPTNSQSLNGYSYLMNNPLAGTDPTGYCAAATGTHIKDCNFEVTTDYSDGTSKTTTGLGAREAANKFVSDLSNIGAGIGANGGSTNQGSTQKSQTDGVKGGASGVGAATERPEFEGGFANEEVRWNSQEFSATLKEKTAGQNLITDIIFSGVILYSYEEYFEIQINKNGEYNKDPIGHDGFYPKGSNEIYIKRSNSYEAAATVLKHEFGHFSKGLNEPDARAFAEQFAIDMGYSETGPGYRTGLGQVNIEAINYDLDFNLFSIYGSENAKKPVWWDVSNSRRIYFWTGLEF